MFSGMGSPGQRGIEKGGRDQDLLTPFWQTVALAVFGVWVLMWLVFLALVIGSLLGATLAAVSFFVRLRKARRTTTNILTWAVSNIVVYVLLFVLLDTIWTDYLLDWSPWQRLLWTMLCLLMMAPAAWLYYHIAIRIADPHYPSPRTATDQQEWRRGWQRDNPPLEVLAENPQREEVAITITDLTTEPKPEIRMCVLFSPSGHLGMLANYAAALVREDESARAAFSFEGGKKHNGARFYRYTRAEYEELEVEASRAGLLWREKKNQPYELTERGRMVLNRLAELGLGQTALSPSPTPEAHA